MRVGLIVNPIAGIGGRAALKGSDDRALVERARLRGAPAVAPARASEALEVLAGARELVELVAAAGEMGEDAARACGFAPEVVGEPRAETSPADTRAAAAAMAAAPVDLLLFAGGDGTAVDVLETVGEHVPILGVPAGVKMHSAVFAVNPRSAGRIARAVAEGAVRELADAEVMDVDEEALRRGTVSPRLHGYAKVPLERALVQSAKARSAPGERAAQERLARHVAAELLADGLWLVGPGSTTRAVLGALGLEKTLLGVDAVESGRLVAVDADESALRELATAGGARILVTPIGGQGFLLGRGNQQLSAEVVRAVGPDRIAVVATEAKLAALGGRPLLVDTGDRELDAQLAGHVRVIAGPGREIVYRVSG